MTKNPPLKRTPAAKPPSPVRHAHPNFVVTDQDGDTFMPEETAPAPVLHTETEARQRGELWARKHPDETIRVYQLIMEIRCDVSEPTVSHVTAHPK